MKTKMKVLCKFLDEMNWTYDKSELKQRDNLIMEKDREFLVLTDREADSYAKERILESLWAFNAEFLLPRTKIEYNDSVPCLEKALKSVQEKLCEDANPLFLALLKDENQFVKDAIEADGRGHFLSSYDSEEHTVEYENETFYIYRQN